MQRQIFIVHAMIVDANGTFNHISGYPKTFDSKAYIGKETATETSVDIAKKRAIGELSEVFAGMCKVDTRQLQTVLVLKGGLRRKRPRIEWRQVRYRIIFQMQ